eukprot:334699-Pelagomonas_calceolata.AAC.1
MNPGWDVARGSQKPSASNWVSVVNIECCNFERAWKEWNLNGSRLGSPRCPAVRGLRTEFNDGLVGGVQKLKICYTY